MRAQLPGLVVLLWSGVSAGALTLGDTVQLQDAGLRFTPIREIPMLPASTPDAYQFTRGEEAFEAFDASELWRQRQTSALFTNEVGRLVVARLDSLPPPAMSLINGRFILAEDLEKASPVPDPWGNEAIAAWIEAFSGKKSAGFSSIHKQRALRYPCRVYRMEEGASRCFLMRLPDPARFVWFEFDFADGSSKDSDTAVLRTLRSVVAGTTRSAEKQANLGFQRMGGGGGEHSEYEQTRRRVIENIDALDDWWYVELPHYVLVSNLDKRNQRLVKELQEQLERVREQFVELWAPVKPIREVSVVRLFEERSEYLNYVGEGSAWTMGLWVPSRKELVISPEYSGSGGKVGRDQILSTAYHEAFHQYVHYALDGLQLPTWLNEGHACLFESMRFENRGRSLRLEENEQRFTTLNYLADLHISINPLDLMHLSRDEFYVTQANDEEAQKLRAAHYSTAWSFVYFLRRGAPVAFPSRGYDQIPDRVVAHLAKQPLDFSGAADFALEGMDRNQLLHDYDAFWASKRLRGLAKKRP